MLTPKCWWLPFLPFEWCLIILHAASYYYTECHLALFASMPVTRAHSSYHLSEDHLLDLLDTTTANAFQFQLGNNCDWKSRLGNTSLLGKSSRLSVQVVLPLWGDGFVLLMNHDRRSEELAIVNALWRCAYFLFYWIDDIKWDETWREASNHTDWIV